MKYLLLHLALLGYFFAANIYSVHLMPSLPQPIQWVVGIFYLLGMLLFFLRLDLVCLDQTLNQYPHPESLDKPVFFLKVFQFYLILLGVPIFLLNDLNLIATLRAYLVFLLIVNTINGTRYALPSYSYYLSRMEKRPW